MAPKAIRLIFTEKIFSLIEDSARKRFPLLIRGNNDSELSLE